MSDLKNPICRECHAELPESSQALSCPACGGGLFALPGGDLAEPDSPPRQADHRGILLPRRHAAGGIITPR